MPRKTPVVTAPKTATKSTPKAQPRARKAVAPAPEIPAISNDDWNAAMQEEQENAARAAAKAKEEKELAQSTPPIDLSLVGNVSVKLSVLLGSTDVTISNLADLSRGSVIELKEKAGETLSVYANDILIAKGEVVVVNDQFGVRLTDIIRQA